MPAFESNPDSLNKIFLDFDGHIVTDDFSTWQQQNGSTNGVYSADGDDDGDVDADDLAIWSDYNGNTLDLFDILA